MASVEQTQKMIPFVTCEISFGQHICELFFFGVDVFDLELGVQIDSIKQPIKGNSLGSGNMSLSAFFPLWSSWSLLRFFFFFFFQTHTIKLPDEKPRSIWNTRDAFQKTATFRSHSSRAGKPSNLNPMSKEMISNSVPNFLEQIYDFQKCTMFLQKWIMNLQDLPRSQSLETVPVCIAW